MPLTASSTLADIRAAIADNASYDEEGSAAKCRAFISAARLFLFVAPKRAQTNEDGFELDPQTLRELLQDAKRWLVIHGRGGSVRHYDFRGFRE